VWRDVAQLIAENMNRDDMAATLDRGIAESIANRTLQDVLDMNTSEEFWESFDGQSLNKTGGPIAWLDGKANFVFESTEEEVSAREPLSEEQLAQISKLLASQ